MYLRHLLLWTRTTKDSIYLLGSTWNLFSLPELRINWTEAGNGNQTSTSLTDQVGWGTWLGICSGLHLWPIAQASPQTQTPLYPLQGRMQSWTDEFCPALSPNAQIRYIIPSALGVNPDGKCKAGFSGGFPHTEACGQGSGGPSVTFSSALSPLQFIPQGRSYYPTGLRPRSWDFRTVTFILPWEAMPPRSVVKWNKPF